MRYLHAFDLCRYVLQDLAIEEIVYIDMKMHASCLSIDKVVVKVSYIVKATLSHEVCDDNNVKEQNIVIKLQKQHYRHRIKLFERQRTKYLCII
jgi:hypothetical protein